MSNPTVLERMEGLQDISAQEPLSTAYSVLQGYKIKGHTITRGTTSTFTHPLITTMGGATLSQHLATTHKPEPHCKIIQVRHSQDTDQHHRDDTDGDDTDGEWGKVDIDYT